ncbi:EamA family transporter [Actinoplanes sp. NBRC 103695]|uniref:EamA family transporter n=1 Tax=Actinoplanes sp. NBRC 103695 TaxID=3032202 RepID=UPI00249FA322|nr:EamA family transporter [Actinoplanes sp. NBRC 103695]GLY97941.1 drug/metabolite exporter YedA [Actinoplanes sp. NBRC 103695]
MPLFGPLLIVYVVWGSTYLAMKVAVGHLPPLTLNAVRFLTAGLILYAWCAWRRRRTGHRWKRPTAREWRAGAIQGLLLPAAGTGGATWAEQELSSGVAALLLATIPLWIVIGSRVVDKERISLPVGLGLLAGVVGVAVLVNPFGGDPPDPLSAAVALGGALCWGLGSVYGRHAPRPEQPLLASAVEMLCAGAFLAVLGGVGGEFGSSAFSPVVGGGGAADGLSSEAMRSVLAVAYLIVFGSLIAYTAYEWLLQHAPPRITGTYAFVNPIVAVLLGWWLLDEQVGPRTLLAGAIIAVAVALIVLPRREDHKSDQH